VPEAHDAVDVLVRQIHTARERHLPVNHGDFAVVAVVVVRRDEWTDGREHLALDAQFLHPAGIIVRQVRELACAVHQHAHLHALLHFFHQNTQHLPPHFAFFHDKVFQKDEMLRLPKRGQQRGEFVLAQRKVRHSGMLPNGIAAAFRDVACHARNLRVALFQMLLGAGMCAEVAAPLANQLCRPFAQKPMPYVTLGV